MCEFAQKERLGQHRLRTGVDLNDRTRVGAHLALVTWSGLEHRVDGSVISVVK
jgi:hypothetical protein